MLMSDFRWCPTLGNLLYYHFVHWGYRRAELVQETGTGAFIVTYWNVNCSYRYASTYRVNVQVFASLIRAFQFLEKMITQQAV